MLNCKKYKTNKIIVFLTNKKQLFYLKNSNKCTISGIFFAAPAPAPVFLERLRFMVTQLAPAPRSQKKRLCPAPAPKPCIIPLEYHSKEKFFIFYYLLFRDKLGEGYGTWVIQNVFL